MGDFKQPETQEDFDNNFKGIKPLMNDTQAYYESARCLFCHDAPCIQSCPTEIDIPLFIRQISTGNVSGAASTIYRSNWMGHLCGQVCPTEVLCEGACVYNHQGVKPIEIGRLQSYATFRNLQERRKLATLAPENEKSVAIIGAGPAGLSAACELRIMGYKVVIFESKAEPSGLALYGVAPYKITNQQILDEVKYLQEEFGFEIKYQQPVKSKKDFLTLEKQFDAILLAVGLGDTRELKLPGEQLEGSWGAVEFIETLKISQHRIKIPEVVVVLGSGNTAMDAASESARMGAGKVILAYRRGLEQKGAYHFEYQLAKSVGVQSLWHVNPLEIIGDNRVNGIKFEKTELVNGRLNPIPGSEFTVDCNMVIRATGQNHQQNLLSNIEGLQLGTDGRIIPGQHPFQSTNPVYFSAGDLYNGGLEVVNAVAEAKKAAHSIDQYLTLQT